MMLPRLLKVWLLAGFLICEICLSAARTTKVDGEELEFKVVTKREAILPQNEDDFPFVEGRTFRASAPLDPGKADTDEVQNIYEHFETVDKIFQPIVEGGDEEPETDGRHPDYETDPELYEDQVVEGGAAPENLTAPANNQEVIGDASESDKASPEEVAESKKSESKYSAQYPYTQTTNLGDSIPHETVSERRVTLVGSGPQYEQSSGYSAEGRRVQTYGGFQDNSFPNTGSNPYRSQSRTGAGYQPGASYTSTSQGTGYQTSGSSYDSGRTADGGYTSGGYYTDAGRRGAYYSGQVYRDNNGHYIDANGRHLDSTGRYYDTSGRYRDASVTTSTTRGGQRTFVDQTTSGGGRSYYSSSTQTGTGIPINSYGGNQFYHSGGSSYPATYNPVVSQISSDTTCAVSYTRVTINGLSCTDAISQLGRFVCYNYERVSTDCCERCLQVKQPDQTGCEYGDRSSQCQTIEPSACYNERNRQICCQRCAAFRVRTQQNALTQPGCEYGDFTRNCTGLIHSPYLCYMPENQRVCCNTCPRLARSETPTCQWGDQSPEFCEPFDASRRLKINCYNRQVRNICCQSCEGLRSRMQTPIQGCEYGDSPTLFRTSQGTLDCVQYIHRYGVENCNDSHTAQACCFTCFRYREHLSRYQRQQG